MGFTPQQIDRMALWEYLACLDGWNAAHSGSDGHDGGPTDDWEDHELRLAGVEGFA